MENGRKQTSNWIFSGKVIINFILIWSIVFIPICFALFYSLHKYAETTAFNHNQIATISSTGMYPPEQIIFTYGIHVLGVLTASFFTTIYTFLEYKIEISQTVDTNSGNIQNNHVTTVTTTESNCPTYLRIFPCLEPANTSKSLHNWNFALWMIGLVASLLLSFVGSVSLSYNDIAHGFFAFSMFFVTAMYMLLFFTKITRRSLFCDYCILRQRIAIYTLLFVTITAFICVAIIISICSSSECNGYNANIFPSLEFLAAVMFLLFIDSFRMDINEVEAVYTVKIDSNSPSASLAGL